MPCNSDYMCASGQEAESARVCKLLVYLYNRINLKFPSWVRKAAENYYGNRKRLDEATAMLCECCRSLDSQERSKYIYNGQIEEARNLASWLDRHQEWDKRRVKEEASARKKAVIRKQALRKLSIEEMESLGFKGE